MLHTIWRTIRATLSALGVVALFFAWGLIAVLMGGTVEICAIVTLFAAVFFAPAAYINTWQEIGD